MLVTLRQVVYLNSGYTQAMSSNRVVIILCLAILIPALLVIIAACGFGALLVLGLDHM